MKNVIYPRAFHRVASAIERAGRGRGTSSGHGASGQLSENHCMARSSRLTWMSAPDSRASNFLPSSNARELTVDNPTFLSSAYERATESNWSMLCIPDISVKLPPKSTAILPDVVDRSSGHATEMDLPVILANINARLAELEKSPDAAAREAGAPDAIRNLRRAIKNGKGGITVRTLSKLAEVLETTPQELMAPRKPTALAIDAQQLRDFLIAQRNLIDQQIQQIEAAAAHQQPPRKRRAGK